MTQPTWGYPGGRRSFRPTPSTGWPTSSTGWPTSSTGWPPSPPAGQQWDPTTGHQWGAPTGQQWGAATGRQWGPSAGGPWGAPTARSASGRPGPWGAPTPPPRRRNPFAGAIRVVLVVAAILFAASILRGMVSGGDEAEDPGQPVTPGGSVVGYRNEDYTPPPPDLNPPDVPGPRNLAAAESLVTDNPVYAESIPTPTNCTMGSLDMARADADAMERHFNELMGCLMTVYDGPVTDAGFELPRPPVTVYTQPIRTACGDFDDVNAAYCTADQRVYYAAPLLDAFPSEVANAAYAAEMILAHEFGHAVQARTAILVSGKVLEDRASSENAAAEMSRRTEVQADCLAGLYVRSVAQSQGLDAGDLAALTRLSFNLGDDVLSGRPGFSGDHGTGEARQTWFSRGLATDAIETCNTFTASSAQVR